MGRQKVWFIILLTCIPLLGGYLLAMDNQARPVLQEPIYQGSRSEERIALTVNVDWGEEYLPSILETCRLKKVPLTFFITGRWAEKYPQLVKEIAAAGHEVGSHGYGHVHPDGLSVADNLREIKRGEGVLTGILGTKPRLYAPPYGERGPGVLKAAEEAKYRTILWSIDSLDWQHRNRQITIERVVSRAHNGAIVLMHPTNGTAEAMPELLEALKDKGFDLVTVSELISDS